MYSRKGISVASLPKTKSAAISRFTLSFTFLIMLSGMTPALASPIGFIRTRSLPIVPGANMNTSFHGTHAFNPSVVLFKNTYFLYFRGQDQNGTLSIGVWTQPVAGFDGVTWNQTPTTEPIIKDGQLADPCAVVYKNQVFLYYMGQNGGSYLATSADGLNFSLQGHIQDVNGSTTLQGDTPCPFVNTSDGKLYLFTSENATPQNGSGPGYEYTVMTSNDGLKFGSKTTVISPSFLPGTIDYQSISTIRLYQEAQYYYAIYGASSSHDDYNEGFGLARSTDLVHWTKYAKNPIFLRGPAGQGDEGAVWSGSLVQVGGVYYLYYEGCGTHTANGSSDADSAASNQARSTEYGGFGSTNFSQIWLATSSSINLTDWDNNGDLPPATTYAVKSLTNSGASLDVNGGPTANGASLYLNSSNNSVSQTWQFTNNAGFYSVSNVAGGPASYQVWDVSGQSVLDSATVDQFPSWGAANQQWQVVPVASGSYAFKNRGSGQVLDLNSGSTVQNPWTSATSQQWSLTSLGTGLVNFVVNPGFEANGATAASLGWSTWTGDNNAAAVYTETGSRSGSYRLTNYSSSPFQVYTYQTLYGIANGTYKLTAWIVGGGAQDAAYLSAKDYGSGPELTANALSLEAGWENWEQLSIPGIAVTNNTLTVGFYTYDPNGGTWISIDDLELTPQ